VASEHGLVQPVPEGVGEREATRQADLARLVRLAEEFESGDARTVAEFLADLEARFGRGGEARGVHLLTLHRAKGLEFEAVFLPRLEERELPCRQALRGAALAEERRLLYVGITRAKRYFALTWSGKPSRFLAELGIATTAPPSAPRERLREDELPPGFARLKAWRLRRARADELPAYVVFHDTTLAQIVQLRPKTLAELSRVPGVGPTKLERYGEEVLQELSALAPG
jgi:DNA helicase-2/ATP-dependent DNA helicase PcrA